MDRPLQEHILRLETLLEKLSKEIMRDDLGFIARNQIEAEIRAAEMALAHYREAFEIEKKLRP